MNEAIRVIREATKPMIPVCLQGERCKWVEELTDIKAVRCTKHDVVFGRKYRCSQKETE